MVETGKKVADAAWNWQTNQVNHISCFTLVFQGGSGCILNNQMLTRQREPPLNWVLAVHSGTHTQVPQLIDVDRTKQVKATNSLNFAFAKGRGRERSWFICGRTESSARSNHWVDCWKWGRFPNKHQSAIYLNVLPGWGPDLHMQQPRALR